VDVLHFDVDALSFTQVIPAMISRQEFNGGEIFGAV
jgi:hypothetical protein